jgi:diguanylate cyclase (GGDEF)-like protein
VTASDRDQTGADDDLARGGDPVVHRRSLRPRQRSARDRDAVSALRDETAGAGLTPATARDREAEQRDLNAAARDALARLHDLERDREDGGEATRQEILRRGELDRARAATDRAMAAEDRERAAADREVAARERNEALRHRAEVAERLKFAATDELTGAFSRQFGLQHVTRELERAHRTGAGLVLAFIDVDRLKEVNDTLGHRAGDALLQRVGKTVRANLRSYDVIVRYGGDEFVCAMPNLGAREARARLEKISGDVGAGEPGNSITFGIGEAEPGDGLHELVARADADLLAARRSRRNDY